MFRQTIVTAAVVVVLLGGQVIAQDFPTSEPQKEHEWLKQFEGEWVSESKVTFGPGQEPITAAGTMKSRMLGGRWIITDVTGDMMGTKIEALQTIGYDPEKKKYIGTWVDSHLDFMWQYSGTVDASGKKIVLEAEGPNFMSQSDKPAMFRDSYEFKSADHIVMTSEMQGEDGQWTQFMSADVRRKK